MRIFTPEELLNQYESGQIVRSELLWRLLASALIIPPNLAAHALPPDVLKDLFDLTSAPVNSADESGFAAVVMSTGTQNDYKLEMSQLRQAHYQGMQRWKEYFHATKCSQSSS